MSGLGIKRQAALPPTRARVRCKTPVGRFSPPARALEHSPNEAGSPELHSELHVRVLLGASTDGGHVRRIRREVLRMT